MQTDKAGTRLDSLAQPTPWVYDDGGRALAGFRGSAGDCFTRAVSIASQVPYAEVYNLVNAAAKDMKQRFNQLDKKPKKLLKFSRRGSFGNARCGVKNPLFHEVMRRMGWTWTPTMRYGQGCKVHLQQDELPSGRIICRVSKHIVAVIDGVIHDTYDSSRGGTRCVYGYFSRCAATRQAPPFREAPEAIDRAPVYLSRSSSLDPCDTDIPLNASHSEPPRISPVVMTRSAVITTDASAHVKKVGCVIQSKRVGESRRRDAGFSDDDSDCEVKCRYARKRLRKQAG